MATFKINGDYDKVSAELKKTLEAREASFNASLQALFNTQSPSMTPTVRATAPQSSAGRSQSAGRLPEVDRTEKPVARPVASHASSGWGQSADSGRLPKRESADTVRGRLRTSIRPSR